MYAGNDKGVCFFSFFSSLYLYITSLSFFLNIYSYCFYGNLYCIVYVMKFTVIRGYLLYILLICICTERMMGCRLRYHCHYDLKPLYAEDCIQSLDLGLTFHCVFCFRAVLNTYIQKMYFPMNYWK